VALLGAAWSGLALVALWGLRGRCRRPGGLFLACLALTGLAGLALLGSPLRPLGIDVGKLWKGMPSTIARMAGELCTRLGQARTFAPDDIPCVEETCVGQGYAVPTAGCRAATRRLARPEGLPLDPVYTGTAFAGLLDLVEKGQLGQDGPIIFLHTGGAPGLFA